MRYETIKRPVTGFFWLTPEEAKKFAFLGLVFSRENWICPICKKHYTFEPACRPNFCSNCGADMRDTFSDGDGGIYVEGDGVVVYEE